MFTGDQIRSKRKRDKLSAEELAVILGTSKDNIYKWEKGFRPQSGEIYKRVEDWLNGKLENVPRGASVSDSEAIYGHLSKGDDLIKIILNLSESSRTHADAALIREQNYEKALEKFTAGDPERMPPASEARLNMVLELLAKIGSGSKTWKSEDEARVELYKIFYGDRVSKAKKGTHAD